MTLWLFQQYVRAYVIENCPSVYAKKKKRQLSFCKTIVKEQFLLSFKTNTIMRIFTGLRFRRSLPAIGPLLVSRGKAPDYMFLRNEALIKDAVVQTLEEVLKTGHEVLPILTPS